jgi:hypothetical protein
MNVKERIYGEIERLPQNELSLLYEQVKLLRKIKTRSKPVDLPITIEELHRYTSSSKTSWAEDVIKHREDRV